MDLNIDDFFSEPKSSDVQELIDDSIPVYPHATYFKGYDLLFFYMPYDDRYCEPSSYGYMDSFEMFKDYLDSMLMNSYMGSLGTLSNFRIYNRVMKIRRKEYHKLYIIDKIKKFVKHIQKELGNH